MRILALVLLLSALISTNCTNSGDEDEDEDDKSKGKTNLEDMEQKIKDLSVDDNGNLSDQTAQEIPEGAEGPDPEEPQGAAGGHSEPTEGPQGAEGGHSTDPEEPQGAAGLQPEDVEDVEKPEDVEEAEEPQGAAGGHPEPEGLIPPPYTEYPEYPWYHECPDYYNHPDYYYHPGYLEWAESAEGWPPPYSEGPTQFGPPDREDRHGAAAGGYSPPREGPPPLYTECPEEALGAVGGYPLPREASPPPPYSEQLQGAEGYTPNGTGQPEGDQMFDPEGYALEDAAVDTKHKARAENSYYRSAKGPNDHNCHIYVPKPGFTYKTVLYKGEKVWEGADGVRCTLIHYCHHGLTRIMYLDLTDGSQLIMKRKGNRWKLKERLTFNLDEQPERLEPKWKRWRKKR